MGETLPQVKIARKYIEKGGEVVFFSHGGKFEHLAKEIGCEVIKLKDLAWRDAMARVDILKIPVEKRHFMVYNKKTIGLLVESEIEAFKKTGVDLVFSSFNPTSSISARVLNIPLVVLISGTFISPYFQQGFATFPDNYENIVTKIMPTSIKKWIVRWFLLNNKMLVRDFNKVGKKYGIKPFRNINDILLGDHTLVCDDINFIGLKPTKEFPLENYTGPIFQLDLYQEQEKEIEDKIRKHLKRPGKSLFMSMGSSVGGKIFLKILKTLNQTDYNVIAICANIRETEKLPKMNEKILLLQYVRSAFMVNKLVDLAIIHGGRGTVYSAAYSGKPVIGIPMYVEQQYNIDTLVRNGCAIRLSWRYFKPRELVRSINKIFDNYDTYLKNSKKLSEKLQKEDGAEKAVKRLMEIIQMK